MWPAIQHIRCFQDKSFVRWPPHINLLYPFHEHQLAAAAERAAEALRTTGPFTVTLSRFGVFDHGGSATVWLDAHCDELVSPLASSSRHSSWYLRRSPSKDRVNTTPVV